MSYRRTFANGTLVCLALALVAVWHAPAHAQSSSTGRTSTGSSSGSSSGSSAAAIGGGFTGGGAAPGGGMTGGGTTPSGAGLTGGSGTGTGTGRTGSGSSTTVPTASNFLLPTYVNPYSAGMIDVTGKATNNKAFGQPTYALFSTATSTGTNTGANVTGGVVTSTNLTGGVGFGYNTYGQGRTYNYVAVPGDTLLPVIHESPKLQANLSDVLQRSASFKALGPLNVSVNDSTVTVDGTVSSAKEKRIVEGMIRMTPGVRAVVNNLQVAETLPNPKTGAASAGP